MRGLLNFGAGICGSCHSLLLLEARCDTFTDQLRRRLHGSRHSLPLAAALACCFSFQLREQRCKQFQLRSPD